MKEWGSLGNVEQIFKHQTKDKHQEKKRKGSAVRKQRNNDLVE